MTNITPEQLKKVAEYMGYFTDEYRQGNGDVNIWATKNHPKNNPDTPFNQLNWDIYNPLQNSDQCLELVEKFTKLASDGVVAVCFNEYNDCYEVGFDNTEVTGKTINEAVTLDAIAYVESIKESE